MSHAFFRGVDWDDVYHKRVPAPFMPTIKNRADTSNFDSEFTSVTPVLTPVQSGRCPIPTLIDQMFPFTDTFRSTFASHARRIQGL
jgi:hypothetical protein